MAVIERLNIPAVSIAMLIANPASNGDMEAVLLRLISRKATALLRPRNSTLSRRQSGRAGVGKGIS
jgi:hypothetical protein